MNGKPFMRMELVQVYYEMRFIANALIQPTPLKGTFRTSLDCKDAQKEIKVRHSALS